MKYMILHYFFMVHLCNIKMSAASTRHKSKAKHYDIDVFISQLLASRKFDDLAEKLAEKAVNKIMHIDPAPAPIKGATDTLATGTGLRSTQDVNQNQLNKKNVNHVKLRKDFTGKINAQAVINAISSIEENLQLKYRYHKKKVPKNDSKEDPSKHNMTTGPADFKDHNNKTEEPISNQNATEKNQNDTKKESIDEKKLSQGDTKDDDWKEDHNRNNDLNESRHNATDGETNDKNMKNDHSLEELSPGNELTINHEAQNSGPEDKGIVEQEASQPNNEIREDKLSSLDEENQKHLTRSEEKIIEELKKTEGEPEKLSMEDIKEDENVDAQFRAREDSIKNNNVTSDDNPYVAVYRTRDSDDRSKQQSPKDQRSKEQSPEDQRSKEQPPEDQMSKEQSIEGQSSKEQSGEESNSSKLKPVIRKEGDKLYTYVRAPEYEDYHEKLAKWRKDHPENPADFMK